MPRCTKPLARLATFTLALGALAACGGDDPVDLGDDCLAAVDMFPVPVSDLTSRFGSVDDDFLFVDFHPSFMFSFYGTNYGDVYLNTNGGMTFGAGEGDYDMAVTDVVQPTIAAFWGDLDAEEYGGMTRANQMRYQACAESFVVTYQQFQDNDNETWNNTATVTLSSNGTIEIDYGAVLSEDIMAGVFDGTHTNDQYVAVASSYSGYSTGSTGTILFDDHGIGPTHTGQLSNQTITYNP